MWNDQNFNTTEQKQYMAYTCFCFLRWWHSYTITSPTIQTPTHKKCIRSISYSDILQSAKDLRLLLYIWMFISLFVCVFLDVYCFGYAIRRASRFRAETGGADPRGLRAYFRNDPIKGQRLSRGKIAVECPMATKFGRENPWPNAMLDVGIKGHAGVRRCLPEVNLLRNILLIPSLVERNPDQSVMHCWGQRSCRI